MLVMSRMNSGKPGALPGTKESSLRVRVPGVPAYLLLTKTPTPTNSVAVADGLVLMSSWRFIIVHSFSEDVDCQG